MHFSSNSNKIHKTLYCVRAQAGQAEHDIMNHTSGVNFTDKSMKLGHQTPGV